MKKSLLFLLTLIFAISACTDNQSTALSEINLDKYDINTPYSFEKVTAPEVWKTFNSTKEMFDACQVPEDILNRMATEALVKTCMSHPLVGIYSAYSDILQGLNVIVDNSNAFQELKTRSDAAEKLIDYYSVIQVQPDINILTKCYDDNQVPITTGAFLEVLLSSGNISSIFSETNKIKLRDAAINKLQDKLSKPDIYSYASLKNSFILNEAINNSSDGYNKKDAEPLFKSIDEKYLSRDANRTKTAGSNQGYITVYTMMDNSVIGSILEEYSDAEIAAQNNVFTTAYPNATMLAPSSFLYNAPSYTWNMKDGGATCWIDYLTPYYGGTNLAKYWTNDYYILGTILNCSKITYTDVGHFAVTSSISGMYESKWGSGPLMRHAPSYCPYSPPSKIYYRAPTYSLTISGDEVVEKNTSYTYSVYCSVGGATRSWTILDSKDNESGYSASISSNGVLSICFNKLGYFTIDCVLSKGTVTIGNCSLLVLVSE